VSVHVELLPSLITFCGARPSELAPDDRVIPAREWAGEVERVQLADCNACLLKLFMLGDSAHLKLKRMGLRVDVHDVGPEALTGN
jgi:hypothetical protein